MPAATARPEEPRPAIPPQCYGEQDVDGIPTCAGTDVRRVEAVSPDGEPFVTAWCAACRADAGANSYVIVTDERAERAQRRATFEAAARDATQKLSQDADERARADVERARSLIAGETFRDGAALYGFLYAHEKRERDGRSLGLSDMQRLRRTVALLWPEIAETTVSRSLAASTASEYLETAS